MNRFDWKARCLLGESLTFGFGYDHRFRKVDDHMFCLEDKCLAEKVVLGEGLSWHQSGLTDFLLFFGGCDDLQIKNIRIINANGFAILTENCEGIYAERLVMKPNQDTFFTGPRDGWKIYRCSGRIRLESCEWEGFRMDAQNIQSNFFLPEQMLDETSIIFRCKYSPIPLKQGAQIRFRLNDVEYYGKMKRW